uniref:Uncharacterized protein n=1 Tax=Steinernema glaseri TaxID=37863 RepID=A0A1I7ZZC6_9BILA
MQQDPKNANNVCGLPKRAFYAHIYALYACPKGVVNHEKAETENVRPRQTFFSVEIEKRSLKNWHCITCDLAFTEVGIRDLKSSLGSQTMYTFYV